MLSEVAGTRSPWAILFADEFVLVAEMVEEIEEWKY